MSLYLCPNWTDYLVIGLALCLPLPIKGLQCGVQQNCWCVLAIESFPQAPVATGSLCIVKQGAHLSLSLSHPCSSHKTRNTHGIDPRLTHSHRTMVLDPYRSHQTRDIPGSASLLAIAEKGCPVSILLNTDSMSP